MVTFLAARYETAFDLLSFTIYYLLKNPHCLRKAEVEVDEYSEITVDTFNKLKYIDAVLKETLRLQPTAPLIGLESKDEGRFREITTECMETIWQRSPCLYWSSFRLTEESADHHLSSQTL